MFSDLQLALAAAGAALLIAVFAYNKWQEVKARKRAEQFANRHPDVLLDTAGPPGAGTTVTNATRPKAVAPDARSEPGGESAAAALSSSAPRVVHGDPNGSVEHTLGLPPLPVVAAPGEVPSTAVATARVAIAPPRPPLLDERIDYLAILRFAESHVGDEILRVGEEIVRGAKNVNWEGYDESGAGWAEVTPAAHYRMARVGLQLVDRRGVVTDDQIVDFCHRVQALAATLVAECDFGSRSQGLRIATELDKLCLDVDIQVGVNIVKAHGVVIPGTKIRALAEADGGELDADGRYRVRTAEGAEVLALGNLEPTPFAPASIDQLVTRGVTLTLDVPRAPDADQSFLRFAHFAQAVARALEAELVDDNRQVLTAQGLGAIGLAVARARTALRDAGIPSGGRLALRLFA